ncbi:MAG: hypothetical protein AB1656_15825 [Candidatus Omnitrophota bacterium]
MKKASSNHYIYPIISIFISILLLAKIILPDLLYQLPPLVLDSISTSETNDLGPFEKSENEDRKNLTIPTLMEFYPIPHTPYIFCSFVSLFTSNEKTIDTYNSDIVIDIEKGKRILRADRSKISSSSGDKQQFKKYIFNYGVLQTDDGPCIFYKRSEKPIPTVNQKVGFLPDLLLNTSISSKEEFWTLNLHGELKKIVKIQSVNEIMRNSPFPTFELYMRQYYRFLDFSHIAGKKINQLKKSEFHDYKIEKDRLLQSDQWNEDYDGQFLFGLPGGGYLINKKAEKCLNILLHGESQAITIPRNVLLDKLPQTPTLPKLVMWIPITSQKGPVCLAYLDAPYFPIFEFHLDQRKDHAVGDWVKFIGYGNEMRPIMTMENNQIVLFTSAYEEMHRDILQWPKYQIGGLFWPKYHYENDFYSSGFSALPTRALPQIPGGQPAERIIPLILPSPINLISAIPLSDDRLLGYNDGVFWSFCWDGSDIRQLFPRDRQIPLIPRQPQSRSIYFADELY